MAKKDYVIAEVNKASGVAFLESEKYGRQIWKWTRLTRRNQENPCDWCGRVLGVAGYRPNLANRMLRVCVECIENG